MFEKSATVILSVFTEFSIFKTVRVKSVFAEPDERTK